MQHYIRTDIDNVLADMTASASAHIPFLFAINFEQTEAIFIKHPTEQRNILFRTPLGSNSPFHSNNQVCKSPELSVKLEPLSVYAHKFEIIMRHLKRGDSFLANLTTKTPIETNLTLNEIYEMADAPYCLLVPDHFVCFSPERFVQIDESGTIETHPMKGTISANVENAEQTILADVKESAEHATIVDLARNDISINAEKVTVEKYRYITRIKTGADEILQVSSKIRGQLNTNWQTQIGNIISDMLPAGSISGAPKKATVEAIKEAEREPRGFYTGVFGYFDGNQLDSAVLIRYIEQDEHGKQYYRSGGGITAQSNLEKEYNEVMQKIYIPTREPKFTEVICVEDGHFLRLDYHQRRMNRTCQHFYGTNLSIEHLTKQLPATAENGLCKCRIVYGKTIESIEFAAYTPKNVVTVALAEDNDIDYTYKYLDRNALSKLVAEKGTDDVIIVKDGHITDSSFCNLVLADKDGKLFTPKESLLKGTYREWLLAQGKVEEKSIAATELGNYESVYFVNAMRNLNNCTKIKTSEILFQEGE